MALVRRQLVFTFTLKNGVFADGGTNQLILAGLRASVRIQNAGGIPGFPNAVVAIWGMTLSHMNRLSTLGQTIQDANFNTVKIEAGDEQSGLTTVFVGNILNAFGDFSQPPQVAFQIVAQSLYADAQLQATPSSFSGNVDVATVFQGIASKMNGGAGIPFRNAGVNGVTLSSPYMWGTLRQQLAQTVRAADISWNGGEDGTITIWPKLGNRGEAPVLVSPETGMVGSPSYTQWGLMVKTVFAPGIKNGINLSVDSTQIPATSGISWNVYTYHLSLDSLFPRGEWFATMWTLNPKFGTVTPVQGT